MIKELFVTKSKSFIGGATSIRNSFTPLELSQLGLVYKCIKMRAEAFANYEQKVYIDGEIVEEHPIYEILESNIFGNWIDIKQLRQKWLDTNGNAYLWFQPITNKDFQIWVLPSIGMNINLGTSGDKLIKGYNLQSDVQMTFTADEILHSKTLVPSRKFWENIVIGKPELLNASLDLLQIEKERYDFYERKLRRDGTVPFVLKTDVVSSEQKRSLKEFFNSVVPKAYEALVVLNRDESLEPLAALNDSVTINDTKIQENIVAIWGIPEPLITGKFANRNTADVLINEFHNNTIYPLVKSFNNDLTRYFRRIFNDERITIASDEPVYRDYEYYLKEMQFDLTHGIKNRNEIRAERDLEPLADGDTYYLPNSIVTVDKINEPLELEKSFDNEIAKSQIWKKIDDTVKPYQKRIEKTVIKTFLDIEQDIKDNINKRLNKDTQIDFNFDLFDVEKYEKYISEIAEPEVALLVRRMFKESLTLINSTDTVGSYESLIIDATKESTGKIAESINTINENTKAEIQKVIAENGGLSANELREKLIARTSYLFNEVYTISRAQTIATTTSTFATTSSQMTVFRENNYDYDWLSRRDGKVRETHKERNVKKTSDGYFEVGGDLMRHPGGGSKASENANCRCYLIAKKRKLR